MTGTPCEVPVPKNMNSNAMCVPPYQKHEIRRMKMFKPGGSMLFYPYQKHEIRRMKMIFGRGAKWAAKKRF